MFPGRAASLGTEWKWCATTFLASTRKWWNDWRQTGGKIWHHTAGANGAMRSDATTHHKRSLWDESIEKHTQLKRAKSKAHLYFFFNFLFFYLFFAQPLWPSAVFSIQLNDPLYEGEQQIWFTKTGDLYITSGILRMCAMIAFVMILEDELQGQLWIKSQLKQKALWRSVEAGTKKKISKEPSKSV